MHTCIFCSIAAKNEEAWIVYEDRDLVAFLDKYPISYGHVLVAPKKHYRDVVDAPPEIVGKVFLVARAIGVASIEGLGASGFRIITNKGSSAGQIIFHFHVHVIPRYGEGSYGPITPRAEITREYASDVVDRYIDALKRESVSKYLP
jgi:histidine triad (HIT) family protein